MQQNNMTSLREMLEQMSTEQLDEMLDKELNCELVDENAVRMIMNVLREREKDTPFEITPEISSAWEKCQRDLIKLEKKAHTYSRIRRVFLRVASAAAVFLLLIAIVPRQAEADSFFDRLFRWSSDIVEFFSHSDDEARFVQYEFRTEHSGLQHVYDTLVELGVTQPVVPMWVPDGYALSECLVNETYSKTRMYSRFQFDSKELTFCVDIYDTDVSHTYYKDDTNVEKHEIDGTTYNIMHNEKLWVVVWAEDNIECSIYVDCQEDVLFEILSSIYMTED